MPYSVPSAPECLHQKAIFALRNGPKATRVDIRVRPERQVGAVHVVPLAQVDPLVQLDKRVRPAGPVRDIHGAGHQIGALGMRELPGEPIPRHHTVGIRGREPQPLHCGPSEDPAEASHSRGADVAKRACHHLDPISPSHRNGCVRARVGDDHDSYRDRRDQCGGLERLQAAGEQFGFVVGGHHHGDFGQHRPSRAATDRAGVRV